MFKRLPENKNLILHSDPYYNGLPVYLGRGPLISQYLAKTLLTMQRAVDAYGRVTGIRIDLRYPDNTPLPPDAHTNDVITRFVESLNSKVDNDRNGKVHDTSVRYTWCREYGTDGKPHYHFTLLFNGHAYRGLGWFESERENLSWRIREAWSSALRLPVEVGGPLVHFPENLIYHIGRNPAAFSDFFYRASYLCKVDTKRFGEGCHVFDSSRH